VNAPTSRVQTISPDAMEGTNVDCRIILGVLEKNICREDKTTRGPMSCTHFVRRERQLLKRKITIFLDRQLVSVYWIAREAERHLIFLLRCHTDPLAATDFSFRLATLCATLQHRLSFACFCNRTCGSVHSISPRSSPHVPEKISAGFGKKVTSFKIGKVNVECGDR
jgi:hypothetical protein